MDYEQKAKAYDEALERAKKELDVCGSQDCDAVRQIFRLFPELENKDERIRKGLKRAIAVALDYSYFDKETADNCLAWLEKQGKKEQNFNSIVQIPDGCHAYIKDRKVYIENYTKKRL